MDAWVRSGGRASTNQTRCATFRAQLVRFGGSEVNTTGDGFLAAFRSAMGNDVGGVAVHAAARIMALAGASEVLASALTVGLAEGSGLAFESLGPRAVKGLDRPIEVHRLV